MKFINNEELFRLYKETGNSVYVDYLYENNKPIAFLVLKENPTLKPFFRLENYDQKCDFEYAYDEAFSNTLNLFDLERGLKFTSLLTKSIKNSFLHIIAHKNTHTHNFNNDVLSADGFSINGNSDNKDKLDFDEIMLSVREKQIDGYFSDTEQIKDLLLSLMKTTIRHDKRERLSRYCIYFIKGFSKTEIAKMEGVSKQTIDQFVRRFATESFKKKLYDEGLSI